MLKNTWCAYYLDAQSVKLDFCLKNTHTSTKKIFCTFDQKVTSLITSSKLKKVDRWTRGRFIIYFVYSNFYLCPANP